MEKGVTFLDFLQNVESLNVHCLLHFHKKVSVQAMYLMYHVSLLAINLPLNSPSTSTSWILPRTLYLPGHREE